MIKQFVCLGFGALMLAGLSTPVSAQHWEFHPSFALEQAYNDNVRFAGVEEGAGISSNGDYITRFDVALPLERSWRKGTFSFSYNPSYEKYDRLSDLDQIEHRVSAGVAAEPNPFTSLSFLASYVNSQNQGSTALASQGISADPFLNDRTDREAMSAQVTLQRDFGARWRWTNSVSANASSFDQADLTEGATDLSVEDRVGYGASTGVAMIVGANTAYGLSYGYQLFELDQSGNGVTQSLALTVDRGFGRSASLTARVGAFSRSFDGGVNELGGDASLTPANDDDGLAASLSYSKNLRFVSVRFGADRRAALGDSFLGTSTNTTFGFTVSSYQTRTWNWQVSTRYALRVATEDINDDLTTIGVGISADRNFRRPIALRMGLTHVDQSGAPGIGGTLDSSQNISFYRASVGIVWQPLGRKDS
ncbi:hypothetical protein ABI59_18795 [Acidobacteria bacterium Mor1]|nr:hypothetical protein ABI59_18795 [Acidobacteria bacterium Mor1]